MSKEQESKKMFKGLSEFKFSKIQKELKYPALMLFGLFLGNKVAVYIDKQAGKPTVRGVFDLKGNKFVKPLAVGLSGLALSQLAKNENFKYLGYGVAASGLAIGAKDFLRKDLLSGVDDETQLPPLDDNDFMMIEGPNDSLELNLEDMDNAMQLIENSVNEIEPESIEYVEGTEDMGNDEPNEDEGGDDDDVDDVEYS